MANNYIPTELYNKKTLFSLGGASLGVWLFTTVIGNVFNFDTSNYKWIGFVVALFLSFTGGYSIGKLNFQKYTIIFFNGLLIYVTACGIDSINHSTVSKDKNRINKSAIIPYTESKIWWASIELTDSIKDLREIVKLQNREILQKEVRIKSIIDSCTVTPTNLNENEIDYKSLYNIQLLEIKKLKETILAFNKQTEKTNKPKSNTKDTLTFNTRINDANALMLKKTSELCENIEKKLDNFNSSGRYNPGTYSVSYLQKDIFEFQTFLKNYVADINKLLTNNKK
jgi:hypothetical protein